MSPIHLQDISMIFQCSYQITVTGYQMMILMQEVGRHFQVINTSTWILIISGSGFWSQYDKTDRKAFVLKNISRALEQTSNTLIFDYSHLHKTSIFHSQMHVD